MYKLSGLACGFVLASSCVAYAQQPTTTITTSVPVRTTAVPAAAMGTVRASHILGSTVHLQGTNNYGRVEDIVFGEDGSPAYLVVSNRGRHAMFPFRVSAFNPTQRVVQYDVTPQAVQPLFYEPNTTPNINDPQFTTRTMQVFPVDRERERIRVRPNGTIRETIRP